MADSLIDQLSDTMITVRTGTSPGVITETVRSRTVDTLRDLKAPGDRDLDAALQLAPTISVAAARGAVKQGAPMGAVVGAIMEGVLGGTREIGGDEVRVAREVAGALVREAEQQGTDLDLTAVGLVTGAAEAGVPTSSSATEVTDAAIRGMLDAAARLGQSAEDSVRGAITGAAYLPQRVIKRVLTDRSDSST